MDNINIDNIKTLEDFDKAYGTNYYLQFKILPINDYLTSIENYIDLDFNKFLKFKSQKDKFLNSLEFKNNIDLLKKIVDIDSFDKLCFLINDAQNYFSNNQTKFNESEKHLILVKFTVLYDKTNTYGSDMKELFQEVERIVNLQK